MTAKRDVIVEEFFQGDDLGFVIGTFDGVLSGTKETVQEAFSDMSDQYKVGYEYGKLRLVGENPHLFSRIITSGTDMTFPEVVGDKDLMRGVKIDDEEESE